MQPDPYRCKSIAAALCAATEQVLWVDIHDWLAGRPGQHRLHCRVGGGEATYYRARGPHDHLLTYGWKMVASKHDADRAALWRTGREIMNRGYFDGQLALSSLLAHTCCHEFAHLVQNINGWISRGSIHNGRFYQILDRMHASGAAVRVLNHIEQQAHRESWELDFFAAESPAPAPCLQPGAKVSFDYRGRVIRGEVIRVNRRTVNVRPVAPRLATEYFRVSPQLLTVLR